MDPNKSFRLFVLAVDTGRIDDAVDCAEALLNWMRAGGFEPNWNASQRDWFHRTAKIFLDNAY